MIKSIYEQICGSKNLYQAAKNTLLRGRRFKTEGAKFQFNLEYNILRLQGELRKQTYKHGKYNEFKVYEPKERTVLAAPVRDRVVHHAIIDVVEPLIDPKFIETSYACRKGKGTHKAIKKAQKYLNACDYALHLDVVKYFPNINHNVLKNILHHYIADEKVLWLFDEIINSTTDKKVLNLKKQVALPSLFSALPEFAEDAQSQAKGLPIGNLSSQFLANLYLNEVDRFVKHQLKCRYYIRYMDDMVFFDNSKQHLQEIEKAVRTYCQIELKLSLHHTSGAVKYTRGLTFLGFRIFRHHRRIKSQAVKRYLRNQKRNWNKVSNGVMTVEKALECHAVWNAHAKNADTFLLRQKLYSNLPLLNIEDYPHYYEDVYKAYYTKN